MPPPMKRKLVKRHTFLLALLVAALPAMGGCKTVKNVTDTVMHSDLVGTVGRLVGSETLALFTSENINAFGESIVAHADSVYKVAPPDSRYSRRLDSLTADMMKTRALSGRDFNFKVYLSEQVNAFATPDGSVRVFSGLMDILDPGEMRFVLAHEVGHIVKGHSREKLMVAIGLHSLRNLAAQQGSVLEDITAGRAGKIVSRLARAQFSQKEEREADDFALHFMAEQGYDLRKAPSALMALVSHNDSQERKLGLMASHPSPKERARRMRKQLRTVDEYAAIVKFYKRWIKAKPPPPLMRTTRPRRLPTKTTWLTYRSNSTRSDTTAVWSMASWEATRARASAPSSVPTASNRLAR